MKGRPGLLVAALLATASAAAQDSVPAPSDDGGYDVTNTGSNVKAPPGFVGQTVTSRSHGVGNTPETRDNTYDVLVVHGGKARQCPNAAGFVEGDFEYRLSVSRTTTVNGIATTTSREQSVSARLKGVVGEDAQLTHVEVDATLTASADGGPPRTERRPSYSFVPQRGIAGAIEAATNRTPTEWEARAFDQSLSAILSAVLTIFSGPIYLEAQGYWGQQNNCIELDFDPASKSKALQPNETITVGVKLKPKEGGAVPATATITAASAEQNQGRVSIQRAQITQESAGSVSYTAPPERPADKGFFVAATSRAGVAGGVWLSSGQNDFEVHFTSTIISRSPSTFVQSRAEAAVPLVATEKPSRMYGGKVMRLRDGTGVLTFTTEPLPGRDPCMPLISGSGTAQLMIIEALITITDNYAPGGVVPTSSSASVEFAYGMTLGYGETEQLAFVLNFQCVARNPEPYPFWMPTYMAGRSAQEINYLKGFDYVGRDGVVARKELRSNCGGLCDEEVSVFEIREVPSQAGAGGAR